MLRALNGEEEILVLHNTNYMLFGVMVGDRHDPLGTHITKTSLLFLDPS